jgi:hypothetical protein
MQLLAYLAYWLILMCGSFRGKARLLLNLNLAHVDKVNQCQQRRKFSPR